MKIGILNFPGSQLNDIAIALEEFRSIKYEILWYKETIASSFDWIIIPPGSSFANYLRPGAIAAKTECVEIIKQLLKSGMRVLGIGNGFQILCEAQLLPGALLLNNNSKFVFANVYCKVDQNHNRGTKSINKSSIFQVPLANRYGRYWANSTELMRMRMKNQILFRYCDEYGFLKASVNPYGSVENIAAISNEEQTVFGIGFNPERAIDDETGNTEGKFLLQQILDIK